MQRYFTFQMLHVRFLIYISLLFMHGKQGMLDDGSGRLSAVAPAFSDQAAGLQVNDAILSHQLGVASSYEEA